MSSLCGWWRTNFRSQFLPAKLVEIGSLLFLLLCGVLQVSQGVLADPLISVSNLLSGVLGLQMLVRAASSFLH